MSATGRGAKRRDADYYPTPAWCVHRFLEAWWTPAFMLSRPMRWVEPCAGDGAIIRAVNDPDPLDNGWRGVRGVLRTEPRIEWDARELRPEAQPFLAPLVATDRLVIGDALSSPAPAEPWDVMLTNPPFCLAMEFVRWGLEHARVVAVLERLNFLGSEERSKWMREHAPDVYVLPNRPVFGRNAKGELGTDSIEYAWFVFDRERLKRRSGSITVLSSTAPEVLSRAKALAGDPALPLPLPMPETAALDLGAA